MTRRLLFALLPLVSWFLSACEAPPENSAQTHEGDGPVHVVATTGMIADLVRAVGGEHVEVDALMSSGVDPHLYQPAAADVAELDEADVVFHNGLHLEGKMGEVLKQASRRRPVLAVAEQLPPQVLLQAEGERDPHVWMDVDLWRQVAAVVRDELSRFDPDRAADYGQNFEQLEEELHALDVYARQSIASIPEDQRVLVTAHDAFAYLGRAYGLEVRGIQGLSTESEAGLRDLEELIDFLVEARIPAVFVESSVPRKSVEALVEGARARDHSVGIGGELFSDAMGPEGSYEGTYPGMIDHNVTTITRALGGEAPEDGLNGHLAN